MQTRVPGSTLKAILAAPLAVGLLATAAGTGLAAGDDAVRKAVDNQLLIAEDVSSQNITVSNRKGVIVLTGSVDTLLEKHQAVELAGSIRGVRSVVDRLEVDWKVEDGRVVLLATGSASIDCR